MTPTEKSETDRKLEELLSQQNSPLLAKLKGLLEKQLGKVPKEKVDRTSSLRAAQVRLHPPYVNNTKVVCSLCSSEHTSRLVMAYCPEEKCYKVSYGLLRETEHSLKEHNVTLLADSCDACSTILMNWPKEQLIALLISRVRRDTLYFEKRKELSEKEGKELLA